VEEVNIVPEKQASAAQRAANAQAIAPTTDTRLTLVTCWPWNSNTHRVIVVARPVE
jgi:sortase (surface protein transpeptidase)